MKPEDILNAIGEVDASYVEKAKKKRTHRALWISLGSLAACLVLALLIPQLGGSDLSAPLNDADPPTVTESYAAMEEVLAYDNVWIYYVEEDEIQKQQSYLALDPEVIFAKWKAQNGIGKEVKLVEVKIIDNGKTTVSEWEGQEIVTHEMGDTFIYTLTLTANLQEYYETIDQELLLQSLEQTMTGYNGIEFDEYRLLWEE